MKWIKIKITTSQEGLGAVEEIFTGEGLSSLEIEDSAEFLEILEKTKPNWDFVEESLYNEKSSACSVSAYIADNASKNRIMDVIREKITKLKNSDINGLYSPLELYFTELDEEDWAENWKRYFKPIPIGKNLLICPVWETVPEEYLGRVVFRVDPGMSFGTGTHETTRLCLEVMEEYQRSGTTTLDLGCGSGILSVTSLLLGAELAVAVDIDENCVPISQNNAKINGIDENIYKSYCGNLLTDQKVIEIISVRKYDIVLMNIIPDVIIPLLPAAKKLKKDGGVIIMSGIIGRYKDDVLSAVNENGLYADCIREKNDWFCIAAK